MMYPFMAYLDAMGGSPPPWLIISSRLSLSPLVYQQYITDLTI